MQQSISWMDSSLCSPGVRCPGAIGHSLHSFVQTHIATLEPGNLYKDYFMESVRVWDFARVGDVTEIERVSARSTKIFDTKPTSAKNPVQSAFHAVISLIYTY